MNATRPIETIDDRPIPGNDRGAAAEARPMTAFGSVTGTDALVDLATKMGLDPAVVRTALETRQYRGPASQDGLATDPASVTTEADDHSAAPFAGATVPVFVISRRYAVIGARGADVLLGVLWQTRRDADGTCAAGGSPSPVG